MPRNRRDFLKGLGWIGGALLCRGADTPANAIPTRAAESDNFQYRTVAIEHLAEMRKTLEKLNGDRRVSQQKTIQAYLGDLEYQAPKTLPKARSLVIVATPWKVRAVGLRWQGHAYSLLIPGGYFYYEDKEFKEELRSAVARRVVGDAQAELIFANPPLKTLAVRSGLAEYGKNNITYVDRYGSFHVLWAFFSEATLEDQWARPYRTMRICEGCSLCIRGCPTRAIRTSDFVIDGGRCITTYNEMKEPLPDWIEAKAHNAVIGCLDCQLECPANREFRRSFEHVADFSEDETAVLLDVRQDRTLQEGIAEKLKGLGEWYAKDIKYLSRNMRLALANSASLVTLQ